MPAFTTRTRLSETRPDAPGWLRRCAAATVPTVAAAPMPLRLALTAPLSRFTAQLLGSDTALRVALKLATHLRARVDRLLAKGLSVWYDFINQVCEAVSGPSEVHQSGA